MAMESRARAFADDWRRQREQSPHISKRTLYARRRPERRLRCFACAAIAERERSSSRVSNDAFSSAVRKPMSPTCAYIAVVAIFSWPSNLCRNLKSTPSSKSKVAHVCRSMWGVTWTSTPAEIAKRRSARRTDCVDQDSPSTLRSDCAASLSASWPSSVRRRSSTTNTRLSRRPFPLTCRPPPSASKSRGRRRTSSCTRRPVESISRTAEGNAFLPNAIRGFPQIRRARAARRIASLRAKHLGNDLARGSCMSKCANGDRSSSPDRTRSL